MSAVLYGEKNQGQFTSFHPSNTVFFLYILYKIPRNYLLCEKTAVTYVQKRKNIKSFQPSHLYLNQSCLLVQACPAGN